MSASVTQIAAQMYALLPFLSMIGNMESMAAEALRVAEAVQTLTATNAAHDQHGPGADGMQALAAQLHAIQKHDFQNISDRASFAYRTSEKCDASVNDMRLQLEQMRSEIAELRNATTTAVAQVQKNFIFLSDSLLWSQP